nr:unnamed protein product [Callosobruchus analis]
MWQISKEIQGKSYSKTFPIEGCPTLFADDLCNVIIGISNGLKNKWSSGDDGIPTCIMKKCIRYISDVLSVIVNNSLKFGVYPSSLKLCLVKPIPKKGNNASFESLRPINIPCCFSKLFETAMSIRLTEFIQKCDLINSNQHGYVSGRSTITAIFEFTQKIVYAMESKNVALGMFLDLSRAYDCLSHELLLSKLELYGIRGNALRWIASFLDGRQQKVEIRYNNQIYRTKTVATKFGVPQGSVIGPLLFIIFVNDMYLSTTHVDHHITSYADDTNILVQGCNPSDAMRKAELSFDKCKSWIKTNRLILNEKKTNVVMFHTSHSQIDTAHLTLNDLELGGYTKFLGVQLDENLNWNKHVDYVALKLSGISYGIRTLSKYLDRETTNILYHANFESVARYGIIFWGSNRTVDKLFVLQKRTLRVMYSLRYNQTCRNIFSTNNIMTICGLYVYV